MPSHHVENSLVICPSVLFHFFIHLTICLLLFINFFLPSAWLYKSIKPKKSNFYFNYVSIFISFQLLRTLLTNKLLDTKIIAGDYPYILYHLLAYIIHYRYLFIDNCHSFTHFTTFKSTTYNTIIINTSQCAEMSHRTRG